MDHKQSVYGVDVSAAQLVIGRYDSEALVEIGNAPEPIAAWLTSLRRGSIVAMEATGRYHQLLAHLAQAAGMLVYVLNPQGLKHYARAVGVRGKTDRIDAQLIARYVVHERNKLHPWAPAAPETEALSQLLTRRQKLVNARQTLMQSLSGVSALKSEREALRATLKRMITNLELLIVREIARAPELAQLHRRLVSVVGIGPLVAAGLVAALARVRFSRVDSFIAYTGLDPRPDDSGNRRGRRRLTKHGPPLLRSLLYTAGMAAAHSKLFRARYAELLARGLQTTEAIVILARKLARIAFALYRSGESFDPRKHLRTA